LKNQITIIVKKNDDDSRIDKWLKRKFSLLTQSYIENKLRRGLIKVNNKKVKSKYIVVCKDKVEINGFSEKILKEKKIIKQKKNISKYILEKFKRSIIFESFDFLIINKWFGISTQGVNKDDISVNDIIKYISNEYNIVHRLDKETTGLLIITKNYKSTKMFNTLFKEQQIEKFYLAICQGSPKNLSSTVNFNIKNKKNTKFLKTITKYKVIKKYHDLSLIFYKPLTGKTHQLRLLSKYLNSAIIGDSKYRINNNYIDEKLQLNAFCLKFIFKNKKYEFKGTFPQHIIKFLKKIKLKISNNELNSLLESF
tara:strand:+ start:1268 stop:2197 length:930 start_codon:yes stop_codon:yes gene_type:complete